jgi:adenine-specific DNA methylase
MRELNELYAHRAKQSEDPMCKAVYRTVYEEMKALFDVFQKTGTDGSDLQKAMPAGWLEVYRQREELRKSKLPVT